MRVRPFDVSDGVVLTTSGPAARKHWSGPRPWLERPKYRYALIYLCFFLLRTLNKQNEHYRDPKTSDKADETRPQFTEINASIVCLRPGR